MERQEFCKVESHQVVRVKNKELLLPCYEFPVPKDGAGAAQQFRWAARMSLSLLWSVYAGVLTAAGFRFRLRPLRVAGLVQFSQSEIRESLIIQR